MTEVKSMIDIESQSAWRKEVTRRYEDGTRMSFDNVSIYRIPNFLKEIHTKSYIPRVVTLGLFHHQPTNPLSEMHRRKVDAVLRMRKRLHSEKQNSFVDVMKDSVSEIKRCYEDETDATDETIAWTCLLDGCFILEILRVLTSASSVEENCDPIYNRNRVKSCQFDILGDFFMMENQLPILVLVKLLQFEMGSLESAEKELYRMVREITNIVHPFLPRRFHQKEKPECSNEEDRHLEKYKHMLGLFHSFVSEEYLARPHQTSPQQAAKKDGFHICFLIRKCFCRDQEQEHQQQQKQEEKSSQILDYKQFLKTFRKTSASELFNSGMRFKPYYGVPSKENLLFVKKKRTLLLPAVFITDTSEMILRNLMAMEVCRPKGEKYISYYVLLMRTLVESEGDVAVLRRRGVIQSSMGSDDEVVNVLKGLCKGLHWLDVDEDPFMKVKFDLNDWYNKRRIVRIKQAQLTTNFATVAKVVIPVFV